MVRAFLDSCIVIYLIQGPEDLSQAVRGALRPDKGRPPVVCVSELIRLECRVWPIRHDDEVLLGEFDGFFGSQEVETIPLQTTTFELATELRARYRTKTPDALHLAASILGGCQEFWTNDHRLNAAAEGRIALKIFT